MQTEENKQKGKHRRVSKCSDMRSKKLGGQGKDIFKEMLAQ